MEATATPVPGGALDLSGMLRSLELLVRDPGELLWPRTWPGCSSTRHLQAPTLGTRQVAWKEPFTWAEIQGVRAGNTFEITWLNPPQFPRAEVRAQRGQGAGASSGPVGAAASPAQPGAQTEGLGVGSTLWVVAQEVSQGAAPVQLRCLWGASGPAGGRGPAPAAAALQIYTQPRRGPASSPPPQAAGGQAAEGTWPLDLTVSYYCSRRPRSGPSSHWPKLRLCVWV